MQHASHVALFYQEQARRLKTERLGRIAFMRDVYIKEMLDLAWYYHGVSSGWIAGDQTDNL